MSSLLGADPDRIDALARHYDEMATKFVDAAHSMNVELKRVDWRGDDGQQMRSKMKTLSRRTERESAAFVRSAAKSLRKHASDQRKASADLEGGAGGGGGGGGGHWNAGEWFGPATAGPPIFKIDPRELGSNEWGTQRPEGPDKWSTSVPIYSKDGEWQRGPSGEIGGGIGDGALGASGTAGYHLGPSATAGVDVGFKDGNLHAGAEAEAKFGLSANAAGEAHLGDLKAAAAASAFVGGVAGVTSGLDIGRDGLSADVGGEAFVGGEAKVEGDVSYGGVGVGGTAGVSYGLGAGLEGHADFGWNKISFGGKGSLTAGLGVKAGGEFTIEPKKIVSNVSHSGASAAKKIGSFLRFGH